MFNKKWFVLLFVCFNLCSSPALCFGATASGSNADEIIDDGLSDIDSDLELSGSIDELDEEVEEDILDEDEEDLYDDEAVLSSDALAYLEDIDRLVADIHTEIVPSEVSDQGQYSVSLMSDGEVSEFSLTGDFAIDNNVVIYEGTFSGTSYRLVFPAEYEQYLIVTDDGHLYNLSGSTLTGRLFSGSDVDYLEYEYSSFVLNSVLGNVASTIYNYGYPSYMRSYYLSTSGSYDRISYNDTYGLFVVNNIVRTVSSDPVQVNNYYTLILMMIGGMMLLCFFKKSHR